MGTTHIRFATCLRGGVQRWAVSTAGVHHRGAPQRWATEVGHAREHRSVPAVQALGAPLAAAVLVKKRDTDR